MFFQKNIPIVPWWALLVGPGPVHYQEMLKLKREISSIQKGEAPAPVKAKPKTAWEDTHTRVHKGTQRISGPGPIGRAHRRTMGDCFPEFLLLPGQNTFLMQKYVFCMCVFVHYPYQMM